MHKAPRTGERTEEARPIRVLLIEDNPADARFITEIIRIGPHASRFELLHKTRLREGLKYLKEGDRPVDAILLDLSLPESRGLDTFLRVLAEVPDLPIVVLTGLDDEAIAVRAVQEGAQDYLMKGQVDGALLSRSILYAVERKRTEKALKEQTRLVEAFFKHTITPLVFLDKDFNFLQVNEAYAKACGRDAREFVGQNHFELYPSDAKPIFDQVVETKEPYQATARPFIFPDHPDWGVTYWDWILVPLLESNGEVESLVFSLNDVTEQKQAEEKLKTYMARLEQSNQALQDFASIASHDLQEPLRKVIAFGSRVKEKFSDTLGEEGKDYLGRMLNATERMQSLLKSLLDYARVTTKAETFQWVELSSLVREVLSDLEVRIEKTGGEILIGELPTIKADPSQMRQLFQNLIGNALKFHKEGEKPVVKVHCTTGDNHTCQIVVEDNGIGFDEKYFDKIFSAFQRLHGKSSQYEGTGMGLAICKKIVERHGGRIWVESREGMGSTFFFTISAHLQPANPGLH